VTQNLAPSITAVQAGQIVSRAVIDAGDTLGLSGAQIGRTVGVSPASVSRMRAGSCTLTKDSKAYELGMLFIRIYDLISKAHGKEPGRMARWMNDYHPVLEDKPANLIVKVTGMTRLLSYLQTREAAGQ